MSDHPDLLEQWTAAWPVATAVWSPFLRLRPPRLGDATAARGEGLDGSFAMIRLVDQTVVVDLDAVRAAGLGDFAVEVLAHEVGHHVLAPATLTDHARSIARLRRVLPSVEHTAPMVANLYTDLMINDRLARSAGLRMAEIFRILAARTPTEADQAPLWTLYLRIYELLWGEPRGALGAAPTDDWVEGDAWLGKRLVRSYARNWLGGVGGFGALCLPYLLEVREGLDARGAVPGLGGWHDTRNAGAGGEPAGLIELGPEDLTPTLHPSRDPQVTGDVSAVPLGRATSSAVANPGSQAREPFEYGAVLRAAGVVASDHDLAVRYYRERARPHLVPFPSRIAPRATEPLAEGLEPWDIGETLDVVDWFQSLLQSPVVVPGLTTVQRSWGVSEGAEPHREPVDLDLYVDSSGSMANPQHATSFPALAGAIVALSALRVGARVQATLWSGSREWTSTAGFVRDEVAVLRVLTGYFGGGTAFPIHVLRDTHLGRGRDRACHILVISDDGVTTMFDRDERGRDGWSIAVEVLERARAGGSLVLNLPAGWEAMDGAMAHLRRARDELGWGVFAVTSWEQLVGFARAFSRLRYGDAITSGAAPSA